MENWMNVTIKVPNELHDRLRKIAKQDRRSVTNLVLILIEIGLKHFKPSWEARNGKEGVKR